MRRRPRRRERVGDLLDRALVAHGDPLGSDAKSAIVATFDVRGVR
jgi:hypothetical protein